MKSFVFEITYCRPGHPNDPSADNGEISVSVSGYSLSEAIEQVRLAKNTTGILSVGNFVCGATHKLRIRF